MGSTSRSAEKGQAVLGGRDPIAAGAAGAIVVGLVLWFFGRAIFGGESFAFRDTAHYYYPLYHWCCAEWRAGSVPLWNPLDNLGEPAAGNSTAAVFYPGKLLFGLTALSYSRRFVLYVVAHFLLAIVTSYWAARSFRASRTASGLAAISYACSGAVLFQYCNVVYLVGAAWLPWGVASAFRLMSRRRSWRDAASLGASIALMTLGGDPQSAYHTSLVAGLCGCFTLMRRDVGAKRGRRTEPPLPQASETSTAKPAMSTAKRQAANEAAARSTILRRPSRVALFAAALAIGGALASVQIVASIDWAASGDRVFRTNSRSVYEMVRSVETHDDPAGAAIEGLFGRPAAGFHHEQIYSFSVGPWRFAELVWPNVGGRMFPTHRRWMSLIPAEGRIWTPTLYFGLPATLLAVLALRPRLTRGSVRRRWLTWTMLLSAAASLGFYGLGWLWREAAAGLGAAPTVNGFEIGEPVGGLYWWMTILLPNYALFRYPAKWLTVMTLAASLLAASAFDAACRRRAIARKARRWFVAAASISGTALAAAILFRTTFVTFAESLPDSGGYFGAFDANGAWTDLAAAFLHALVVASLAAVLLTMWGRVTAPDARRDSRGRAVWLLLAAVDLGAAGGWLIATVPDETFETRSRLLAEWINSAGNSPSDAPLPPPRFFRTPSAEWMPWPASDPGEPDRLDRGVRWERQTGFGRYYLLDRAASIESYGSMLNAEYAAVLAVSRGHNNRPRRRSIDSATAISNSAGASDESSVSPLSPSTLNALGVVAAIGPADVKNLQHGTQTPDVPSTKGSDAASATESDSVANSKRDRPDDLALATLDPRESALPRTWIVHDVEWDESARDERWTQRSDWQKLFDGARAAWFPSGRPRDMLRSAVVDAIPWSSRDRRFGAAPGVGSAPGSLPRGDELGGILHDPGPLEAGRDSESCRIVRYESSRVVIDADLAAPGLVVLSDLYAEGWRATVTKRSSTLDTDQAPKDRTPIPILRTNRIFRGVSLPAGRHRIEMSYEPRAFRAASAITLAAWLALILNWLRAAWRQALRKQRSDV